MQLQDKGYRYACLTTRQVGNIESSFIQMAQLYMYTYIESFGGSSMSQSIAMEIMYMHMVHGTSCQQVLAHAHAHVNIHIASLI